MITGFQQFKLNKQLFNAIAEKGYNMPTAIQLKAIPLILAGQDVIGIAQTGTGKTAAYLLPLIKLLSHRQGNDPRVLIVLPTRELAMQVAENFMHFAKYTDLRMAVAYGATGARKQIEEINKGIDVIIATPGRLLELYQQGQLILKRVEYFVLDEAERLMDISFINQLYRILEVLPRKRKHLLFSATMSDLVKRITDDFVTFPIVINIAPEQKTAVSVSQLMYLVPNIKTKINLLEYIIRQETNKLSESNYAKDKSNQNDETEPDEGKPKQTEMNKQISNLKLIVFCKTKTTANNIHKYFVRKHGDNFARLVHGNKSQQARINAVKEFKEENICMLVATDVAARGIDISDVTHVINFDVPVIYEDYIHRIGRTGRAFKTGKSITFVSSADVYQIRKIEELIKQKIDVAELPEGVKVENTLFDENQLMAREIDKQKRKENPEFSGAFHEKKSRQYTAPKKKRKSKSRFIS